MSAKWVWRTGVVAGGILLAAGLATAQVPAVPGVPAAPAVPGVPGAAAVPGVEPKLGFFAKMCAGIDNCRRKLCATPAGQMLNNMTAPISGFTGGVIPGFCPVMPSDKDLDKPGVAGTSDAIKKDALEAKMRRDKVRFLATVDCRYYPDAIKALTTALRTDGSECVRYEAAIALSRGCCCNQMTIDALDACVSGTERDGNPAERSVRVRCVAAIGLERCLSCYVAPPVEPEPKPPEIETPPPGGEVIPKKLPDVAPPPTTKGDDDKGDKGAKAARPHNSQAPSRKSIEAARKTLEEFKALFAAYQAQTAGNAGDRASVMHIIRASAAAPAAEPMAPTPMVRPAVAMMPPPAMRQALGQPSPFGVAMVGQSTAEPNLMPPSVAHGHMPDVMPAPAPFAPAPVVAVAPPPPPPPVVPVTASAPPAAPPMTANPITPVLTQVLKGATPADRHAAIRQLVKFDWREHPIVVSVLVAGAKSDPVPAVRVDCLRHLVGYQMAHPQVIADLGGMANDSDPWVRDEAAKALAQLRQVP